MASTKNKETPQDGISPRSLQLQVCQHWGNKQQFGSRPCPRCSRGLGNPGRGLSVRLLNALRGAIQQRADALTLAMRQLTTEELNTLEAYGCLVQLNRAGQRADPVSVFVDLWPDFRVLLIKPHFREAGDFFKDMTVFSKSDVYLGDLLARTDVIDWNMYICLATELHHEKMLEVVAINRGVPVKKEAVCHMLVLREPSEHLQVNSLSLKLSSLNESHLALVNSSWKFGCEHRKPMIKNMILNFPSCCVLDADDQPVVWILTYPSCALGMLYTVPEHRGKGYAKALVSVMSKRLHSQGYPVYCFIEEENQVSYRLFTSLGFTEEPDDRAAWFVSNDF